LLQAELMSWPGATANMARHAHHTILSILLYSMGCHIKSIAYSLMLIES